MFFFSLSFEMLWGYRMSTRQRIVTSSMEKLYSIERGTVLFTRTRSLYTNRRDALELPMKWLLCHFSTLWRLYSTCTYMYYIMFFDNIKLCLLNELHTFVSKSVHIVSVRWVYICNNLYCPATEGLWVVKTVVSRRPFYCANYVIYDFAI